MFFNIFKHALSHASLQTKQVLLLLQQYHHGCFLGCVWLSQCGWFQISHEMYRCVCMLSIASATCCAMLCLCSLQAKGLRPQLFLSAEHFEAASGQPLLLAPSAPALESDSTLAATQDATTTTSSSSKGKAGSSLKGRRSSIVPQAARQILEVFVLDKHELNAKLDQQQQRQGGRVSAAAGQGNSSSSIDADPVQEQIEQLGLAMAVLTTFTRLLELKMIAMEGEEGTGSLEADLQQLGNAADDGSAAWRRHCLLYRAGQKALVRSYITAARSELQDTLAELQALMEARGDLL